MTKRIRRLPHRAIHHTDAELLPGVHVGRQKEVAHTVQLARAVQAGQVEAGRISPRHALTLQRTMGNRAFQRLLVDGKQNAEGKPQPTAAGPGERSKQPAPKRPGITLGQADPDQIQRAVGFEFQVGWKIGHRTPPPDSKFIEYPKETKFYRGDHWRMENDGDEIEFVVDPPFEETVDGQKQLVKSMAEFTDFTDKLNAKQGQGKLTKANAAEFLTAATDDFVEIEPAGDLIGQPQATAGVRLDRIQDLFKEMGKEGGDASKDFLGSQNKQAQKAYTDYARQYAGMAEQVPDIIGKPCDHGPDVHPDMTDHEHSDALKGLVTMIIEYLKRGQALITGEDDEIKMRGGVRYAKYISFVMARTDFGSMFMKLPKAEKEYYQAHPDEWVTLVLVTANLLDDNTEVIQKEITDNMGSKRVIPVKRGEWLKGMTRGEDLLTAAKQPLELDPKGGNRLRALGLLGNKFDTVGGNKEGAIFEFREMPKNLRYDQWWPFAQSIFQYIMQLNASQDDEEKPTYRSGVG